MHRITLYFGLLTLLLAVDSAAQQSEFVSGKLIDSNTRESVVFATVRVKNRAIGVISNMDGTFKVPLKFQNFGDTLEISCLGYVSKALLLSRLLTGETNIIKLEPAVEQLKEVVVREKRSRQKLTSGEIVSKAIAAIPKNYPYTPFSYVGYYRDYQLKENEYYNFNEAIIEVFDRGFGAIEQSTSKVKIYDYKRNQDFPRDTVAEKPYNSVGFGKRIPGANLENYGGNEFVILRVHDAVRNHAVNAYDFVNRLDVDFKRNHSFELQPETSISNESLYVVAFFRNEGNFWAEGKIYIAKSDFSIYKLDYDLFKNEGDTRSRIFSRQDGDLRKLVDIKVEYRRYQGKMYLNYISTNNFFWVKQPPDFTVKSFYIDGHKKCYEINFTRTPEPSSAKKSNRYIIYYRGRKSKIGKVEVLGPKVLLFPDLEIGSMEYNLFSNTSEAINLFSKDKSLERDHFQYEIRNLVDLNGQNYNESKTIEVNQFRDFFVQEAKPNQTAPEDTSFMKKNRPIFSNQPTDRSDISNGYWMNTPLQKTIN